MGIRRSKLAILAIALPILAAACTTTIGPNLGTPTTDSVIIKARKVARDLDSYRSTVTFVEKVHHPENPELDSIESTVHGVEMEREKKYKMYISSDLELIQADEYIYSWQQAHGWNVQKAETLHDGLGPAEFSPLPPSHPESWLDRQQLGDIKMSRLIELDGKSVYLIEGLVQPPPPKNLKSRRLILTDKARIYIDPDSFQVVRVEVDRNVQDSQREDTGYQVIPGVVEIETTEIHEYFEHNSDIEIVLPDIQKPA